MQTAKLTTAPRATWATLRGSLFGAMILVAGLLAVGPRGAMAAEPCASVQARTTMASPGAGRRLALVIANANYSFASTALTQARADSEAVSAKLGELGFDVTRCDNLGQREMRDWVASFSTSVARNDFVLIYYIGHAVEREDGRDFLLPVDANPGAVQELRLKAIALDDLYPGASFGALIVLDTCRDNPLTLDRAEGARGYVAGAHAASPPAGVMVLYACAHTPAADPRPNADTSLFAQAVINAVGQPGASVDRVFQSLSREIRAATLNHQTPLRFGVLEDDFIFSPVAPAQTPPAPSIPAPSMLSQAATGPATASPAVPTAAVPTAAVAAAAPSITPAPVTAPNPAPAAPGPEEQEASAAATPSNSAAAPAPANTTATATATATAGAPAGATVGATVGATPVAPSPAPGSDMTPAVSADGRMVYVTRRPEPAVAAAAAPPVEAPAPAGPPALPPPPAMEAVPEVTPPPAFCSIQAKFDFLEKVHKPAYAAAIRNNDAARGYLATLNQLAQDYDSHSNPAAVLARDRFRTFEPKAREAYDLAGVLLQLDQKIRDAPLEHCSGGKAG